MLSYATSPAGARHGAVASGDEDVLEPSGEEDGK